MKKTLRKLAALLLPVVLLLSVWQIPAAAKEPAVLRVAVLADPHLYPDEMTGDLCAAYLEDTSHKGRPAELAETLFVAALKEIKARAKTDKPEFLLIPGDMTRDGEYDGHVYVVDLLKRFEKETGIPVAVVPGNHDVNKGNAADYSTGKREQARNLSPEEFLAFYAKLGYDLPGCERMPGTLSYAADLGKNYRLIAFDDNLHSLEGAERPTPEALRDWIAGQCKNARAAGKAIIGMGHHTLAEQFGGQEALMNNFAFGNPRGFGEALADTGMHFYLSGHLHVGEIAMLVSDGGEPLYDITTASSAGFPGEYRIVRFSASGKKIEADVRSRSVPLSASSPFPGGYYADLFGRTFGADMNGGGLAGNIKARAKTALRDMLGDLKIPGSLQTPVFAAVNVLVDKAFALPVSDLPCDRFIDEYGFGDPHKPGTVEDAANSAMVYMFGKKHDPADDDFMQDFLRRIQNGEFVDQALSFALPALLSALSGFALSELYSHPLVTGALDFLAALAVSPGKRAILSESLYHAACGLLASQSPTGSRDGVLVYSGPIDVPTGPGTFRRPENLGVKVTGLTRAEITWYTRQSANTPELIITDKDGNPAPEVKVTIGSGAEDITAEQIDIGFTKILGRTQPALKHTARLTGLQPGKTYRFTAGDGVFGWWGEARSFTAAPGKMRNP